MTDHADTIRRAISSNSMMNDWPLIRSAGFTALEDLVAERQQAIDALRVSRPYVYGVMSDRRMNKDWRYETARDILERVDAVLVSLGETE